VTMHSKSSWPSAALYAACNLHCAPV